MISEISISGSNLQSAIMKEFKHCFVFMLKSLDFAISSLILSLIFATPVDYKCLKIYSACGLLLFFSN